MFQRGFTLIELMIVVAIVSILAAIAMPAYMDYTTRARISEGMAFASAAKTSIVEYYLANQSMPNQTQAGVINASTDTLKSVVLTRDSSDNARLIISYKPIGVNVNDGQTIIYNATGLGSANLVGWACSTASTVAAKYRPSNCR